MRRRTLSLIRVRAKPGSRTRGILLAGPRAIPVVLGRGGRRDAHRGEALALETLDITAVAALAEGCDLLGHVLAHLRWNVGQFILHCDWNGHHFSVLVHHILHLGIAFTVESGYIFFLRGGRRMAKVGEDGFQVLASGIEAHHDYLRFSWAAGGTAEAPLYIKGTDFVVMAGDGRIKSVVGFVDAAPART